MRKIIHVDMDAFYASVEQRDNPDLRGKPIAVGMDTERGVITTASYEARAYGVHSAMPSRMGRQICPGLVFVNPRFDIYKSVSMQIREIFLQYTDLVEPLSLDEAFLDVTENKKGIPSATIIAGEIKNEILNKLDLTASAGVSFNKFLAKSASDINKPDGLFVITPIKATEFIEKLPIEKFFGIGKVTASRMHEVGIKNGQDLKKWSEYDLISRFGKMGKFYFDIVRGIDGREVNPNRPRKSIGVENTFPLDIQDNDQVKSEIGNLIEVLSQRMKRSGSIGKTLTLKIKYSDFKQVTKSRTIQGPITDKQQMEDLVADMYHVIDTDKGIRLLGLTLSNLLNDDESEDGHMSGQLSLKF